MDLIDPKYNKLYFSLLPEELIPEILKYLSYTSIVDLYDIFQFDDFELLFKYNNPEDYIKIKNIFSKDKYMKKYYHSWDILYNSIYTFNDIPHSQGLAFYRIDPIMADIYYSELLYRRYPKMYGYKYKHKLNETLTRHNHPWFAMILELAIFLSEKSPIIKNLIKNGKLVDKLSVDDIFNDNMIDNESKIIILYILIDDENFTVKFSDSNSLTNLYIDDMPLLKEHFRHYYDKLRSELYYYIIYVTVD